MWQSILKWIGIELIKELGKRFREWLELKNEERKKVNELKKKFKILKEANTKEEYKAAIRNINI